jgi:hypothetical protein
LDLLAPHWSEVESLLVADPDGLTATVCSEFEPTQVAEFFPAAAALGLRAGFDSKLLESSGAWASRRAGVWQLQGITPTRTGEIPRPIALGVITPRLTANSQLRDPLYAPATESTAALLVRCLVLRRLASAHLGVGVEHLPTATTTAHVAPAPQVPRGVVPHLRSVVAQIGARLPQASVVSAVNFLHDHPRPEQAWEALQEWANGSGSVLTVTAEQVQAAHKRASRAVRRAEEPEREDIDTLLPIGWDARSRVVRVTYSRPSPTDNE